MIIIMDNKHLYSRSLSSLRFSLLSDGGVGGETEGGARKDEVEL